MHHWSEEAFLYHLYPLGALGAPWTNPGGEPVDRITKLVDWIEPAARIGANTLLLGPLWQSGTHGYDTHDYQRLDTRLGTNEQLRTALSSWKARGFRIVFDGVFNHCGRGFAPFEALRAEGRSSRFASWFQGVDFNGTSPFGDPFTYEGWNGHLSLVKFNLSHPDVVTTLFEAVGRWIDDFDLDGLRLDAADVIDKEFLKKLAAFCRAKKSDFWLMGEVIHGDYSEWAPGVHLDSVTNYELYKGLWSSHNDGNYHEVAWSLNRQFGPQGVYQGALFSTFGDNHDVNRLASTLVDQRHLYPHAILSATVPGIPTVYYGSEAGLKGEKTAHSDEPLRPAFTPNQLDALPHQDLRALWGQLAQVRQSELALRRGDYRQAAVSSRQLAFWRGHEAARPVLVVVNSATEASSVVVEVGGQRSWIDVLNHGTRLEAVEGRLTVPLWPCWGSILVPA